MGIKEWKGAAQVGNGKKKSGKLRCCKLPLQAHATVTFAIEPTSRALSRTARCLDTELATLPNFLCHHSIQLRFGDRECCFKKKYFCTFLTSHKSETFMISLRVPSNHELQGLCHELVYDIFTRLLETSSLHIHI